MSNVLKYSSVVIESGAYLDTDAGERLRVIKNEHKAQDHVRRTIDMTIAQAAAGKAQDVVAEASRQAREIIDKAHTEALLVLEDARSKGLDEGKIEGFEQGVQQGKEQIEEFESDKIRELQAFCDSYETQLQQRLESLQSEVIDFACSLATKIVGVEIDRNDDAFVRIFSDAALHIGEAESVTLRVNEKSYEIATRCKNELMKCISGLKNLTIEKCDAAPGTCVIDTPMGTVDASVETQMDRAREVAQNI